MRKRLLSALLAMAMVLTMLPVSAFATGEDATEPSFTVHFQADQATASVRTGLAANNTSDNTMWVAFAEPQNGKIWFVIEGPEGQDQKTYGILANADGEKHNHCWSFDNPWNFEKWSDGAAGTKEDTVDTLTAGVYTVKAYSVKTDVQDWTAYNPDNADLIDSNTVELKTDKGVLREVMYADVVAAPIVSKDDPVVKDLYTGTPEATDTVQQDGTVKVAIAVENLKEHLNDAKPTAEKGLWAGFSLVAPVVKGADVKVAYSFNKEPGTLSAVGALEENVDGKGAKGIAFYANKAAGAEAKTTAVVQWYIGDVAISAPVTYVMNLDGVKEYVDTTVPTVVPAPMEDHPETGTPIPVEELGTVTATIEKGSADKTYNVAVTGTNIVAHHNAQHVEGTWVGFGMPIEDGTTYKYTLKAATQDAQDTELTSVPGRVITVDGKKYNTVYFDEADEYTIEQAKVEGQTVTVVATYKVTVAITPKTTQKTPITSVEITMNTAAIKVGDLLPAVSVVTVPAEKATVTTEWFKEDGTKVEESVVKTTAGKYTAKFTVTPADGYELPTTAASYKVNGTAATAGTDGSIVLKAELTVNAVTAPEAQGIGFEAVGADANAALTALRGQAGVDDPTDDCEDNTMYARFIGLNAEKTYKVVFTKAGVTAPVYQTNEVTGQTTLSGYFTFTGVGSTATANSLSSGVYTATLQEKTGETWAAVKDADNKEIAKSVELNSLKLNASAEATYYEKGRKVTAPTAPAVEHKTFAKWVNAATTPKADVPVVDGKITVDKDIVLEAVYTNGKITSATVKDQDNLVVKVEGNAIAITGMMPAPEDNTATTETITVLYNLDTDALGTSAREAAVTLNYANNKYTAAADAKLTAVSEEVYTVTADVVAADITVKDPAPVVDDAALENTELTDAQKTEATDAAASVAAPAVKEVVLDKAEELATVVAAESTEVKLTATAQELVKAGVTDATKDNIEVIVQPVMDVKIESYDPTEKQLTLDITAGYRLVAVKDNHIGDIKVAGEAAAAEVNAVVVGEKQSLEVAEPIEISVELPASLVKPGAGAALETIAVLHGKGEEHYHTADITANDADPSNVIYTATFTSTDGLSPFTFAAVELKARYDGKEYKTLQDAVNAIPSGVTTAEITVLDANETATVQRAIQITLVAGEGVTLKDNMLTASGNYELDGEVVNNVYKFKSKGGNGPIGGPGGGASGTTTYSVNVPTTANGTVTVNPRNAAKDATVTITVAPNQGYHLDTLTVTDKDGNTIELTKVDSNKYTFKMPASRVEIKATFVEGEAPAISFTDVVEGEYYVDAVKWAVDKGITNGLTDTTFGPNASCTRAQMVTFLWRAAGSPEPTTTTTAFTDVDSNEYYYKAMLWAVEKGITKGTTDTTFAPNATVTRAQTVTFLYRYAGSPAVNGTNAFTDLEAGEYYVDAVQWAATNGITTGTTETTFSPANNCTRGQIVTFLYRHIVK